MATPTQPGDAITTTLQPGDDIGVVADNTVMPGDVIG